MSCLCDGGDGALWADDIECPERKSIVEPLSEWDGNLLKSFPNTIPPYRHRGEMNARDHTG